MARTMIQYRSTTFLILHYLLLSIRASVISAATATIASTAPQPRFRGGLIGLINRAGSAGPCRSEERSASLAPLVAAGHSRSCRAATARMVHTRTDSPVPHTRLL